MCLFRYMYRRRGSLQAKPPPCIMLYHAIFKHTLLTPFMIRLFLSVCEFSHKFKNIDEYLLYLDISRSIWSDPSHCPSQGCQAPASMRRHNGSYARHFVCYTNGVVKDHIIRVLDCRCSSCGSTHALLPAMVVPFSSFSLGFLVSLIYCRITRRFDTIEQLCLHFGISTRTYFRIIKRFLQDALVMRSLLQGIKDTSALISALYEKELPSLFALLRDFFACTAHSFLQPRVILRPNACPS